MTDNESLGPRTSSTLHPRSPGGPPCSRWFQGPRKISGSPSMLLILPDQELRASSCTSICAVHPAHYLNPKEVVHCITSHCTVVVGAGENEPYPVPAPASQHLLGCLLCQTIRIIWYKEKFKMPDAIIGNFCTWCGPMPNYFATRL